MRSGLAALALGLGLPAAMACNASNNMPDATDTEVNNEPIYLEEGDVWDGGFVRYNRQSGYCSGQSEGGESDTVFVMAPGSTLRNAIIGKDQGEGVYCLGGGCTIENVWFEDVCEDAISIKEDESGAVTVIRGGGAFHADDKVIQHNGGGRVEIYDFYVEDYGKVYRSCGNCDNMGPRDVYVEGVTAVDGSEVVGINLEDTAELVNVCTDHDTPCQYYEGAGDKAGEC